MRIIDWMIHLPEPLEREFRKELYVYEEAIKEWSARILYAETPEEVFLSR